MKLSSLKFKEITSLINNKDLTLDLFQPHHLFEKEQKTSTPRGRNRTDFGKTMQSASRPGTSRERAPYFNYQYDKARRDKNQKTVEDCFYYLQKSLIDYIQLISSEERKCIRKEMEGFAFLLRSCSSEELLGKLEQLEGALSKRFSNRLMHLTFYLVFNKLSSLHSTRNLEREIKHYTFCEYYGRKFNFKQLTLAICIEIQSLYCALKNYEQSRLYARKSLRLAVVLGDDYHEVKMIENLSMLNYYEGRLNQESCGLLDKEERRRILENYSEDKELPDIFKLGEAEGGEEFTEFGVERHNNFIENSVPSQNVKYFQTNYHEIVKAIPKKNINVRGIIAKVGEVGLVRKYFSKDNFITIRPECHIIRPTNQEQILITHKRNQPIKPSSHHPKKLVRRLLALFEDTISCYAYTL